MRWHDATALPDGVDKFESSRWQLEAKVPELANMPHGGDRKSDQAANLPLDISQQKAAGMLNVSKRNIQTVKAVERDAPELLPKIGGW